MSMPVFNLLVGGVTVSFNKIFPFYPSCIVHFAYEVDKVRVTARPLSVMNYNRYRLVPDYSTLPLPILFLTNIMLT